MLDASGPIQSTADWSMSNVSIVGFGSVSMPCDYVDVFSGGESVDLQEVGIVAGTPVSLAMEFDVELLRALVSDSYNSDNSDVTLLNYEAGSADIGLSLSQGTFGGTWQGNWFCSLISTSSVDWKKVVGARAVFRTIPTAGTYLQLELEYADGSTSTLSGSNNKLKANGWAPMVLEYGDAVKCGVLFNADLQQEQRNAVLEVLPTVAQNWVRF